MASTKMIRLIRVGETTSIIALLKLLDLFDAVALVEQHHFRLVLARRGLAHRRIGADDQQVTDMRLARRGTVERDRARAAWRLDDVGGEALAVLHVVEVDLLVLAHVGGVQQVFVDAAAALVMQVGLGDGGAVQLGAQHHALQLGGHFFFTSPSCVIRQATTMSSSSGSWKPASLVVTSFKKSSTLRAYSALASAATSAARLVSPTIVTPYRCVVLPGSVSGQLPPAGAAMSTITLPGFMLLTISSVTSTGAGRPGISAVVITTSAAATRLATSIFWRSSQLCGIGRA